MKTPRLTLGFSVFLSLLVGTIAALLPVASWGAPVDVTTCGQSLTGRGFLSADLDCTGYPWAAVTLESGKLDLT